MKVSDLAEKHRIQARGFESPPRATYGIFLIPFESVMLRVVASDASLDISKGWEHVSVSLPNRCPNWREMSFIKNQFWEDHETVIQFHPRKSDYVNNHPYCLHLWKQTKFDIELPPTFLV